MSSHKNPSERPRLLRLILIGLFLYGGVSYSLSLLEYTFFEISGQPALGVTQTYTEMSESQHRQLTRDCGTQLLGASGVGAVAARSPVVVRCGRFWPFYRYSLRIPADPSFPGVEVEAPTNAVADTGKQLEAPTYISSVRLINYMTFALALGLLIISIYALYQVVRRRNEQSAYRWSLRAFVGSVLVLTSYLGMIAWVTPHFAMGW